MDSPVDGKKPKPTPSPKIVFESDDDRNPLSFLNKPRVQKALFWVALLGVLLYLRTFFALIFLTFLFAILMEAVVQRTPSLVPTRRARVVFVFTLLLGTWVLLGFFMIPRIADEVNRARQQLPQWRANVERTLEDLRTVDSDALVEIDSSGAVRTTPEPESAAHARREAEVGPPLLRGRESRQRQWWAQLALDWKLLNYLNEARLRESLEASVGGIVGFVPSAFGHLMWAVTVFFLAHIFAFLIVWDWPALVRGYRKLEQTRAGPFFQQARETFSPFGTVLAQALGAQFVIALLNTALTAVGMALLGIPMIEVMSIIVFICSFIPVAGVFISSTPICLVALANNGPMTMVWFIVVVIVVHMVEAYILNPRIYGAHLSMNPFVVLMLLVVAHHMLGLWGLLLATPVTAYVFHHVLKKGDAEEASDEEVPDPGGGDPPSDATGSPATS